jgi:hypothetical protein
MSEPVISVRGNLLINNFANRVRLHVLKWAVTVARGESFSTPELTKATEEESDGFAMLKRYIARLESKAERLKDRSKFMAKKYQAITRTEMSEDDLTEFYRLLYAWEDARDEYMQALGGTTFNQDDVKAKAAASVEAKAQLEDFVKGLCKREEVNK